MSRINFAGLALLVSVSMIAPAHADGVDGSAVIGGALGGAAGAAIGSAAGGRNTAIIGSAIGAAAGTAIATNRGERVVERRVVVGDGHYYDRGHDRGRHRGHYKRKHRGRDHHDD
ncbi:MAG: hypothetical protein M3A44_00200 [Gammaproteobacteria bacterium]